MWSFVGTKGNKQWIWLSLDVETREIVGVYVGDRSREGAQGLWKALPAVYRQCAVFYTDFWSAYDEVFPSKRHQSVGKERGKTSYVVRASVAKQNALTAPYASESHDWGGRRYHFPKS